MLLYGDPKVGKSFAAIQMAVALAEGQEWMGFRCKPLSDSAPAKVVYIQLDTPRSLWADRLEKLQESGLSLAGLLLADRETLNCWPFNILLDEHVILLKEALSQIEPDCVIIDTLRECHSGDENDSTAMQTVIARLEATVKPAALVLVAHGRKANPETGPSLINDNRGSNYVVGKMDAIVHMSRTSMSVGGRAVDEQTIRLSRLDNGLWELAERDKVKNLARELLASEGSLRQKARQLAAQTGKEEAACLSLLYRLSE
jgi:RecA-family ATPase